jgi:uncharacterized membrane protein HdeD (DUF308 family)
MLDVLTRNWGWVVLRGIAAIIFGALTVIYPEISLKVMVLLFGVYAIVDGVALILMAVANRQGEDRWVSLLVGGVLAAGIGALTLLYPAITAMVLLAFIAAWAIVTGIAEIAAAVQLRKVIKNEWLLIIAGVFAVAFGVMLAMKPAEGAVAVALLIGAYAIVAGIVLLAFGFELRKWRKAQSTTAFAA